MVELTAEQFAQRAFDLSLISERDLQQIWAHFSTRDVPLPELTNNLVRRGLMTNYQTDRLMSGEKLGFFYGDYKVLYFVGNGSFARVYRAVHKDTAEVMAIKVLRKRHSENREELERFLFEGKVGSKLRHPNIVPIHEVHSVRRTHFLVMSFVEGQSLKDFVRIRKKVEPLEGCKIMSGVIAGLVHAHEKGITHRDLKLSNILISSDGQPQLVDFGLASVSKDTGQGHSNTRTIDYAALEKLAKVEKDDPRSDLFFAGCMFYHMLCGIPPLSADRQQRMSMERFRNITPIRQHLPDLPLAVEKLVSKSMEIEADKRYAKPVEVLIDLRKAIKSIEATENGIEETAPKEGNSKSVLVVESNTAMQDALRAALKKHGYRVLVISDASRGLNRLLGEPSCADCVIISTASLGRDGLELFQGLSQNAITRDIPIVLLLGKNQTKLLEKLQLTETQRAAKMPLKLSSLRKALLELIAPS